MREILAIIQGLRSWHYLHGSPFQVQVFTDHKNLFYVKEARKLNWQQAHWLLDLADFNLKLIHVPSAQLNAPGALSQQPDLIPKIDDDNEGVTLFLPSLFVNLILTTLNDKIVTSSQKDPLVLQALQTPKGEGPT